MFYTILSVCIIIISVQLKHASRQGEHEAVCMVFSVVYLRRGASAGGFLWKAPGCENRASQSGLRGCVNRDSSRASSHWTGPLQTETMSQPQESIHVPPSGIISQMQPGKCIGVMEVGYIRTCTYPYRLFVGEIADFRPVLTPENITLYHLIFLYNKTVL